MNYPAVGSALFCFGWSFGCFFVTHKPVEGIVFVIIALACLLYTKVRHDSDSRFGR